MEMIDTDEQNVTQKTLINQIKELNISSDRLRKIADLMDKQEIEQMKPVLVEDQHISALQLPDFETLSQKIEMKQETYDRLKNKWESLPKFDFEGNYKKFGEHTKEFYSYVDFSGNGRKRMYIGQLKPSTKISLGMGVRVYVDGEFEEGFWLKGKQHGYGRCMFPKGGVYMGQFKLDKKHGLGEYTYADGEKYIGHYVDNSRDGEGSLYLTDGAVKTGLWLDNQLEEEYEN